LTIALVWLRCVGAIERKGEAEERAQKVVDEAKERVEEAGGSPSLKKTKSHNGKVKLEPECSLSRVNPCIYIYTYIFIYIEGSSGKGRRLAFPQKDQELQWQGEVRTGVQS